MTEATIRRMERKAKAIDLLGGECINCGSTENLEFDHTSGDREDMKHTIAYLLLCNWPRILKELALCQLLCKPCHIAKTWAHDRVRAEHGSVSSYTYGCRCDECKKAMSVYNRGYRTKVLVTT